ncbi:PREDICTED: uncharacterized protein LOC108361988 [Rhagoletis zephyria]|uniref:uncharacterized protein LOC108361988 n=1 Tax=Rhagoletis zephyria TaxID=28612 RepID=UPI0008114D3D|nr:PREDICTED: uncharacterized protein LOC108361988 [Rhagoletis zephyria]
MNPVVFFYTSSSDSDEEHHQEAIRCRIRDKSNPMALSDAAFRKRFRLSKDAFSFVLSEIKFQGHLSTAVPPMLQLAATLSLLAIIGCIDGTHFALQKPTENEHMFYNRRGYHSLNSMIICDHEYRILAIDSKYGGAAHDSFVWKHSAQRRFLEDEYNRKSFEKCLAFRRLRLPFGAMVFDTIQKPRRWFESSAVQ